MIVDTASSSIRKTVYNVTGYSFNGANDDIAVWKYDKNGSPDSSFGTNGIAVFGDLAGGNDRDRASSITLDSNNKICITGYSSNGDNYDTVILRLNPDGSFDSDFGNSGIIVYNHTGNGNDYGNGITVDIDGNVYITGSSSNGLNNDMIIQKYTPQGELYSGFGTNGIVIHNNAAGGDSWDGGNRIIVNEDMEIYVAGGSNSGTDFDYDMVIWKYK